MTGTRLKISTGVTPSSLIYGEVFVQPVSLPAVAAVFLDYDGTLTPIVDRPEDAVISDSMRAAVRHRLVASRQRPIVKAVVDALLAEHPGQLKVTPGKMVYEIQPNVDWNKGKAVQYLLQVLHVDGDDVVPLYLGDDDFVLESVEEVERFLNTLAL